MQISKTNTTNFGAIPDVTTRKVLLALERKGVDTTNIMRLIKENFADKFIFTKYVNETMHIGLFEKEGRYASQIKEIIKFNPNTMLQYPEKFAKWFSSRLNTLAKTQTPEQIRINKIENFFGRFPDEDSYRFSSYTKRA